MEAVTIGKNKSTQKEGFAMAYTRKTKDEYQLLYNCGNGWEYLLTEDTTEEAEAQKKEYSENIPEYQYKVIKKRIPLQ